VAVECPVTEQNEPEFGRGVGRLGGEGVFQLFEVGDFVGRLKADGDGVGSAFVRGVEPELGRGAERGSIIFLARGTYDDDEGGFIEGGGGG
jgi:hypothetical protein